MKYFTTTSKFEQEIVVKELHYKKENATITGFTRWDVLEDTSSADDKLILMMPTWRSWFEEFTDEDFQKSNYYINYSHILQDDVLVKILEKYNVRMIFYIHPKFASFQKNFTAVGDRITLVPFGSEPLNEIIKKCHMLITDYSSVCWDVYYQKKPVYFISLITISIIFPMEVLLIWKLNYLEDVQQMKKHSYYFEYIDDKNSQRTYEYLKKKGVNFLI